MRGKRGHAPTDSHCKCSRWLYSHDDIQSGSYFCWWGLTSVKQLGFQFGFEQRTLPLSGPRLRNHSANYWMGTIIPETGPQNIMLVSTVGRTLSITAKPHWNIFMTLNISFDENKVTLNSFLNAQQYQFRFFPNILLGLDGVEI